MTQSQRIGPWLRVLVVEDRLEHVVSQSIPLLRGLAHALGCAALELDVLWVRMFPVSESLRELLVRLEATAADWLMSDEGPLAGPWRLSVRVKGEDGLYGDQFVGLQDLAEKSVLPRLMGLMPDLVLVDERFQWYNFEGKAEIEVPPATLVELAGMIDDARRTCYAEALANELPTPESRGSQRASSSETDGATRTWELWPKLTEALGKQQHSPLPDGFAPYVVQLSVDPRRRAGADASGKGPALRPEHLVSFVPKSPEPARAFGVPAPMGSAGTSQLGVEWSVAPEPAAASWYRSVLQELAVRWCNAGALLVGPLLELAADSGSASPWQCPWRPRVRDWNIPPAPGCAADPLILAWVEQAGSGSSHHKAEDAEIPALPELDVLRDRFGGELFRQGRSFRLPAPLGYLFNLEALADSPVAQWWAFKVLIDQASVAAAARGEHPPVIRGVHAFEYLPAVSKDAAQAVLAPRDTAGLVAPTRYADIDPFLVPRSGLDQLSKDPIWEEIPALTALRVGRLHSNGDLDRPRWTVVLGDPGDPRVRRWEDPPHEGLPETDPILEFYAPAFAIRSGAHYRILISLGRMVDVIEDGGHFYFPALPLAHVLVPEGIGPSWAEQSMLLERLREVIHGVKLRRLVHLWEPEFPASELRTQMRRDRFTPEELWRLLGEICATLPGYDRRRFDTQLSLEQDVPLTTLKAFMLAADVVSSDWNRSAQGGPKLEHSAAFLELAERRESDPRYGPLMYWLASILGDLALGQWTDRTDIKSVLAPRGSGPSTDLVTAFRDTCAQVARKLRLDVLDAPAGQEPEWEKHYVWGESWRPWHFRRGQGPKKGTPWIAVTAQRRSLLTEQLRGER